MVILQMFIRILSYKGIWWNISEDSPSKSDKRFMQMVLHFMDVDIPSSRDF